MTDAMPSSGSRSGVQVESRPGVPIDHASAISELRAILKAKMNEKGRHRSKNSSAEKKNRELASLLRKYALGSPQHAESDRIKVCDELANALESTKNDGDMVVLASCIEVETELLDLHPPGHPGRAKRASNLAHSLRVRFEKTNDYHSLTLAIELGREALSLRPDEHPLRAQSCNILATLLTLRFEHTADEALLDEAIQLEREALALRPYYDADRVYVSCFNLAASLVKRFERTGDASLLDEAIDLERQVLGRMTRVGHPDRAMALTNLALSLQTYFNHTGAISMLDEALQLHRESFALRPANHPLREMSCTNLASSLMAQFERTGDGALLDEAVQLQREALALDPDDHPNKAITYVNLAASLSRRYEQTADKTVLDEAIRLQRHSLVLLPAGHVHRADACANLAAYLKIHFDVAGRIVLLDEAIKLEYEVLLLRPEGHPKRPEACANTAVSLKARFAQTGDRMVLNEAVELEREALRLCPRGHSDRVMACTHLAASLLIHFRQCGEDNILLSEASDLVHEALEMCPLSHPQRWRCLRQLTELALLRRDYGASVEHLNEALRSPTHEKLVLLQFAVDVIGRIDTRAASCASSLLIAYAGILDLMSLSSNFALDVSTQLQHTLKVATLGSAAYMTASRANELLGGLQLLERARGMVWAQMLHWRNPRLDRVPGQLAQELQSLLRACVLSSSPASLPGTEIASSQSSFQPERDRLYAQRSRLQQVLQEIRALPGLENVMRGPDAGALLNVSLRNAVVVLVADDGECHALVLVSPQDPLVDVVLPGVDARTLQELTLSGWAPQKRGAEDDDADEQRLGMKTSKRPSHAHAVLAKLWRTVVKPVLSRLSLVNTPASEPRPRLHWCPTGAFAFVPVHAAGIHEGPDQECCADYVISSYTPTLTALLRAQHRAPTYRPEQVHLLALAVEQAYDRSLPRLRFVEREAALALEIAAAAGAAPSRAPDDAGAGSVVAALESMHMVHLACHGIQHDTAPLESRFCLGGGNLTVAELMRSELKGAFCAFLSACETAKGDRAHADEAVHLAATMLFAGFRSVVATMWTMGDEDGPDVARLFYEKLFEAGTIDVDAVPRALDYAVTSLRRKGVSPERWATFIHMGA